jgi:hypothetical protein
MAEGLRTGERMLPGDELRYAINRHFEAAPGAGVVQGREEWLWLLPRDNDGLVGTMPDIVWAVRPHPDLPQDHTSKHRIETHESPLQGVSQGRIYEAADGHIAVTSGLLCCELKKKTLWVPDDTTGVPQVFDRDASWRFINWIGRATPVPPDQLAA